MKKLLKEQGRSYKANVVTARANFETLSECKDNEERLCLLLTATENMILLMASSMGRKDFCDAFFVFKWTKRQMAEEFLSQMFKEDLLQAAMACKRGRERLNFLRGLDKGDLISILCTLDGTITHYRLEAAKKDEIVRVVAKKSERKRTSMSHFSVLVLTNNNSPSVEELLAPYDESISVAPYITYTRQEAIDFARKKFIGFDDESDERCWEAMAEGETTDEKGNIYSTYNPSAKWDYWEEGGRWSNCLRLKSTGKGVNSAKLKNIDFSPDDGEYKKALRFWDIIVEHAPLEAGEEEPFSFYKDSYYKEFYGTRENYAKRQTEFFTFAVVTPDGLWHEKGRSLWFGLSDETPKEAQDWEENFVKRFIEPADGDTVATNVDCHI